LPRNEALRAATLITLGGAAGRYARGLQVAVRATADWRRVMAIVLVNLTKNLKFARFTIDVLKERLAQLTPPCNRGAEECERFIGETHAGVDTCDKLHEEIRERAFCGPLDLKSMAWLGARFEELRSRITAEVTRFDLFERPLKRRI
jgi:hypothetical protein